MVQSMKASVNGVKPFTIQRRKAILVFKQEDYEGLHIEARLDVDLRTFLDLQILAGSGEASASDLREAFSMFGDQILESWNLEDEDGSPVTADANGFLSIPPSLGTAILTAWSDAASKSGEVSASA
jgi:hypothetical protein